jgi:hypothetical protein
MTFDMYLSQLDEPEEAEKGKVSEQASAEINQTEVCRLTSE